MRNGAVLHYRLQGLRAGYVGAILIARYYVLFHGFINIRIGEEHVHHIYYTFASGLVALCLTLIASKARNTGKIRNYKLIMLGVFMAIGVTIGWVMDEINIFWADPYTLTSYWSIIPLMADLIGLIAISAYTGYVRLFP